MVTDIFHNQRNLLFGLMRLLADLLGLSGFKVNKIKRDFPLHRRSKSSSLSLYFCTVRRTFEVSTHVT